MKNLVTFLMMILLVAVTFTVVSAQTKLHIKAEVVDDIGISAEDIEKGAKKFFGRRGFEVVDESGDGIKELLVTVGKDDADDDNDSIEDSADNDDDGDKIEDNQEKVEAFDLYDRLPCDMITALPDQNKQEGIYVIISGADQSESIRFNSFVDTFAGGTAEMADDDIFQFHLFYPAVEQGFIELPKSATAMTNGFNHYFQKVSFEQVKGAKMDFKLTTIDYGVVARGSDPYRIFKFTNVGNEPLVITSAQGSCGCTVPEWSKEPVLPGGSSEIKVKYDIQRVAPFQKQVTLTSNDSVNPTFVLTIKGEVKP